MDNRADCSPVGDEPITHHELLAHPDHDRLLDYFNDTWWPDCLAEKWLMTVIVPVLKPRKSAKALTSYSPVSLISATCEVLELVALARVEWIS
ncbi:hypothetical protein HPB49_011288 [Dermacentor silvarum]|uniref:Uncharacterized protein n=1 Tax=Dermacentor silvarum TaxID=543639 RepID=A0ACB8CQY6_DERSI|nr:hypothetical protein HPB49_011288 [Dermacentor silvarum]